MPGGERGGGILAGQGADAGDLRGFGAGEPGAFRAIEPSESGGGVFLAPFAEDFVDGLGALGVGGKTTGEGE